MFGAFNSPEGHTPWDYGDSILHRLAAIESAVEQGQGENPIPRRIPFNFTCDATGNGSISFDIPRGMNWTLGGIAFQGGNTGYVAVYASEENPFTLYKVLTSATIVSDSFEDSDEVTHDDVVVVIVARSQPAGQQITGNIRIRQYRASEKDPKPAV